jgi:hypothetical protein
MTLTREQIEQWIADLRSGNFKQRGAMLYYNGEHCALGVLAEQIGDRQDDGKFLIDGQMAQGYLPSKVLSSELQMNIIWLNLYRDFNYIADYIEMEILPNV